MRYVARPDLGDAIRICVHGNYLIVFEPHDDGALILRVLHGARDLPGILGSSCSECRRMAPRSRCAGHLAGLGLDYACFTAPPRRAPLGKLWVSRLLPSTVLYPRSTLIPWPDSNHDCTDFSLAENRAFPERMGMRVIEAINLCPQTIEAQRKRLAYIERRIAAQHPPLTSTAGLGTLDVFNFAEYLQRA